MAELALDILKTGFGEDRISKGESGTKYCNREKTRGLKVAAPAAVGHRVPVTVPSGPRATCPGGVYHIWDRHAIAKYLLASFSHSFFVQQRVLYDDPRPRIAVL